MQGIHRAAVSLDVQQVARQIGKQDLIGSLGKGCAEFADGYGETVASIAGKVEVAKGLRKASPQGGASVVYGCQRWKGHTHEGKSPPACQTCSQWHIKTTCQQPVQYVITDLHKTFHASFWLVK